MHRSPAARDEAMIGRAYGRRHAHGSRGLWQQGPDALFVAIPRKAVSALRNPCGDCHFKGGVGGELDV